MSGRPTPSRPGVLFLNFGGPRGPSDLVPFLHNLFDDVLPLPSWLKPVSLPMIARARARRVRANYEAIGWSPIIPTTAAQVEAVCQALGPNPPPLEMGMLFTPPTVADAVDALRRRGANGIVALALFPQYSLSTTASAFARVDAVVGDTMPVHYVRQFHAHPRYIAALGRTISAAVAELPGEGPVHLLFSPHGLPMSFVERGDPYPAQVEETVQLVLAALDWRQPWHVGWQSRVGPAKWLAPSTIEVIDRLGSEGARRVVVVPVSFVGEHIETLHEIDVELAERAHQAGITHFGRAKAVGLDPQFISALADVVTRAIAGF